MRKRSAAIFPLCVGAMAAGAGGAGGAGKVWIVTGANSGIGVETVKGLVADGHRVLGAVRDTKKRADLPDSVELRPLDLASLDSVRQFVRDLDSAEVRELQRLAARAARAQGRTEWCVCVCVCVCMYA